MGLLVMVTGVLQAAESPVSPPEVFLQGHDEHSPVRYSNPVLLPHGPLVRYSVDVNSNQLVLHTSQDGGHTWKRGKVECQVLPRTYGVVPLLDRNGEIHLLSMVGRGEGQQTAVDFFIDVWHQRTSDQRTRWEKPNVIYEGYCGALADFKQLSTGRLIVPFAWWVPHRPVAPPIGANLCTAFYSDDGGTTWHKSKSDLSAPCYPRFVGNNYGADEPSLIELRDGTLWMLMRTQTGFLYESFSHDQGQTWSEAHPSRFVCATSPPMLWRMPDGRILVLWNNCESPPAHGGRWVYCNRGALHAALSDDEGKTWRGFREVYRDPLENETPPNTDHGSAYPTVPVMANGRILFLTGQGKGRRNLVSVDPRWLTLTHHEDDFSQGLAGWIAFKPIGPSRDGVVRARVPGPQLVAHPSKAGAKVLRLRKPDEHDPDGALWNFPNGFTGRLTLRILLNPGFGGASITLTDRAFKPTDDHSERLAIFTVQVRADGQIGPGPRLNPGKWYTVDFAWNLAARRCDVRVKGHPAVTLKQLNPTGNGISYLHLSSKAQALDPAGFLVESVSVDIHQAVAPELTAEHKRTLLERYVPSYYEAPPARQQAAQKEWKLF